MINLAAINAAHRLDVRRGDSPQGQPLLHLPEKTGVELVQRLEGGEDGVLQRVWGRLVLSYGALERLRSHRYTHASELR